MLRSAIFIGLAGAFVVIGAGVSRSADDRPTTDVFTSGTGGYHTYRIPSLLATPKGALLAFCEGRKTGAADDGDIDLLMRRSDDGGRNWGPTTLIHEDGGAQRVTIGNPCAVVDATTGTIWLTATRNNDDVLLMSSRDDGRTWTAPRTITAEVKKAGWTWYATGPGVGIQLAKEPHAGRLVIPCDHREIIEGKPVMFSHVFYSDDHGASWKLGGTVDRHTDECQVVELSNGELLINMRNYWGQDGGRPDRGGRRALARSRDGGATWSPLEFDATLIEPICQASLIAAPQKDGAGEALLVFSNPASTTSRRALTVRFSDDGGKTWPTSALVDAGPAAYSCLAALPDGRIGLLYERGKSAFITFTALPAPQAGATTALPRSK